MSKYEKNEPLINKLGLYLSNLEDIGLDLSNLSKSDLILTINELNAYISLQGVPMDFGDGLIEPTNLYTDLTRDELQERLNRVTSYLLDCYSLRNYDCDLNCDYECECSICCVDRGIFYFYSKDAKYKNRYRRNPSYKKYRNLLKGYNIKKHSFIKKDFIFTDLEFEKSVEDNLIYRNGSLESIYSAATLVGKGYYKIYDNRLRKRTLKKTSRKKVRTHLKNLKNNLSHCDYKKVYDLDFNYD